VQAWKCHSCENCRESALESYTNAEYERFHDLAWKTVQTGPRRSGELMYLLARAQSLSGRPQDAFAVLGRRAEMGVATDAATNDDFRPVRELPDWPDLEARMAAAG